MTIPRTPEGLRRDAGLTQAELAARAGFTTDTARQVENGADVKVSTLSQYAAALRVPFEVLAAAYITVREHAKESENNAS